MTGTKRNLLPPPPALVPLTAQKRDEDGAILTSKDTEKDAKPSEKSHTTG